MDLSVLDELIAINKKSDASKQKKELYYHEITAMLSDCGLTKQTQKYLIEGFPFCGAAPLAEYLFKGSAEEQNNKIKSFYNSDMMKNNERNIAFKFDVALLLDAVKKYNENPLLLTEIIKDTPVKAKNKKGQTFGDAKKVLSKYLLSDVKSDSFLLNINTVEIKKTLLNAFIKVMSNVLAEIKPSSSVSPESILTLKCWLDGGKDMGVIVKKASKKEKKDTAPVIREITSCDVSFVPEDVEKIFEDFSSIIKLLTKLSKKGKSTKSDSKTKKSNGLKPSDITAIENFFSAIVKKISVTVDKVNVLNEKNEAKKRIIEEKTTELIEAIKNADNLNRQLKAEKSTVSNLNSRLEACRLEVQELKQTVSKDEELIEKLQNEINKMNSVVSVYSSDKQSSQEEQLNAIASKLKSEYTDFLDAEEMEMTIDLGENLRYQIRSIFKILAKSGIDVEGRK